MDKRKGRGTFIKGRSSCSLAILSPPFSFPATWNAEMVDGESTATLEYKGRASSKV